MTSLRESNLAYAPGEHPVHGTWLSVDVVALTRDLPEAKVVLIKRGNAPHRGKLTLPGALLAAWDGEDVTSAAHRVLQDKAGIACDSPVVDVAVVSDKDRDERGHTVSLVVATRVAAQSPGAVAARDVPKTMPFDHSAMLHTALRRIGERLLVDPDTTYGLLGDYTTFPEVLAVYRACGVKISDSGARSRLDRSELYKVVDNAPLHSHTGRPPRGYASTR